MIVNKNLTTDFSFFHDNSNVCFLEASDDSEENFVAICISVSVQNMSNQLFSLEVLMNS